MSIYNKIQNFQNSEWYPLQGSIDFITGGKVKVTPDPKQKDVYVVMDERAINEDFIHPVVSDRPGISTNNFEFQVKKGTAIEFHYKDLIHNFNLDPNEKGFYVDPETEQFVFLEQKNNIGCDAEMIADTELHTFSADKCCQWVYFVRSGCCSTDHNNGHIYGFQGCSSPADPSNMGCWHNDACCP